MRNLTMTRRDRKSSVGKTVTSLPYTVLSTSWSKDDLHKIDRCSTQSGFLALEFPVMNNSIALLAHWLMIFEHNSWLQEESNQ